MFKLYFNSFEDFIAMGGHGVYVWLCYGIVSVTLIAYFLLSSRMNKNKLSEIRKFYQRIELSETSEQQKPEAVKDKVDK